jgi:bacillithiol biosynthesis cysteine-adding enzyme BshC
LFRKELTEGFSYQSLKETVRKFPTEYKLQTPGREINLFYLEDGIRERIVKNNGGFEVVNTGLKYTAEQLFDCLEKKPECFSPNVVLRPLMQELLLPNVAFIGGGSEIAYWLELGEVFKMAAIPFPVLLLRNSYLIIDAATTKAIQNNKLQSSDFFLPENDLALLYLQKDGIDLQVLSSEKQALTSLYAQIKLKASEADITLADHVEALLKKSMDKMQELEKKIIRAEKRKNETALKRISEIKNNIFPEGSLQERCEGGLLFLSLYGGAFIKEVLRHSQSFNQQFCILSEE